MATQSCLENPRDRGASWAAVNGVAQSQTRLKRLSSSSSGQVRLEDKQMHVVEGVWWARTGPEGQREAQGAPRESGIVELPEKWEL